MIFRRTPPMTDDEFVEHIRRQMSASRFWPRIWLAVWGVLFVGFSISFFWFVSDLKRIFPMNGSAYNAGFALGTTMGLFFISTASKFIHALVTAFLPKFRLHQLLVKYYDDAARAASGERRSGYPSRRNA